MAKPFIGGSSFMVCAGDIYIVSHGNNFLRRMDEAFSKGVAAAILLQKVKDPRQYRVAVIKKSDGKYDMIKVVEKLERPLSNLAIMPFCMFTPETIEILENFGFGVGDEIQLTNTTQKLIEGGHEVIEALLEDDELRLDIYTPETYWKAVKTFHEHFKMIKNE